MLPNVNGQNGGDQNNQNLIFPNATKKGSVIQRDAINFKGSENLTFRNNKSSVQTIMPINNQTPLANASPNKHVAQGPQMGESYGANYLRSSNPSFSNPMENA